MAYLKKVNLVVVVENYYNEVISLVFGDMKEQYSSINMQIVDSYFARLLVKGIK
ncbi:hypothetical protein LGL08_03035 [Clostridium estertheticum]|uniref:hypothetical protein n=1 Tax=Clostridium estertheticum TaxID=238834 RepID=UPI001CF50575|nr:hypothetical protein [Clostridium estertheticum]MCB2305102.1 hypothetical protein [Clostridium estertheticum]MCB2343628.1 hypothetical protein [Clostridium estertheticum]MCB2348548.1 hypothetical protein [Clostridium estertheticum]WAG47491.1 hypothetical protein LL127_08580 [Clostridium estertheticum]